MITGPISEVAIAGVERMIEEESAACHETLNFGAIAYSNTPEYDTIFSTTTGTVTSVSPLVVSGVTIDTTGYTVIVSVGENVIVDTALAIKVVSGRTQSINRPL